MKPPIPPPSCEVCGWHHHNRPDSKLCWDSILGRNYQSCRVCGANGHSPQRCPHACPWSEAPEGRETCRSAPLFCCGLCMPFPRTNSSLNAQSERRIFWITVLLQSIVPTCAALRNTLIPANWQQWKPCKPVVRTSKKGEVEQSGWVMWRPTPASVRTALYHHTPGYNNDKPWFTARLRQLRLKKC